MIIQLKHECLVQAHRALFKCEGLKVTYCGPDRKWTQFTFDEPILPHHHKILKFKIIKCVAKDMMIGILDYPK